MAITLMDTLTRPPELNLTKPRISELVTLVITANTSLLAVLAPGAELKGVAVTTGGNLKPSIVKVNSLS